MKYSLGETETVFLTQGTLRFGYEEMLVRSVTTSTFSLLHGKWYFGNEFLKIEWTHMSILILKLRILHFQGVLSIYKKKLAPFSVMHMLVEE